MDKREVVWLVQSFALGCLGWNFKLSYFTWARPFGWAVFMLLFTWAFFSFITPWVLQNGQQWHILPWVFIPHGLFIVSRYSMYFWDLIGICNGPLDNDL